MSLVLGLGRRRRRVVRRRGGSIFPSLSRCPYVGIPRPPPFISPMKPAVMSAAGGRRRRRYLRRGAGFFGDLWRGIKNVGRKAWDFANSDTGKKVLPIAWNIGKKLVGLGRRRRVVRRRVGRGGFGLGLPFGLGGLNVGWGRKRRVVRRRRVGRGGFGLNVPFLGGLNVGWGRKRRVVRRRRVGGRHYRTLIL